MSSTGQPRRGMSELTFLALLRAITEEKPLVWYHAQATAAKTTADKFYDIKKRYLSRHPWLGKITCSRAGNQVSFRMDTTQSLTEDDLK